MKRPFIFEGLDGAGKTTLAHEVAMQIAAMNPENTEELLKQEYIRDGSKTIEDLVKENIAKLGENIQIGKFSRLEI